MKIKKSVFAATLALVLALGLVAGAGAAGLQQKITATLDQGITIKYDGEVVIPKDANGNRVYPIMYNGTTYLPIRAVGNMMDIGVDWDGTTRTVLLGNPAGGVDLIDTFKPYNTVHAQCVQTTSNQTMDISGISCTHWIRMFASGNSACIASYNVEGKYDSVTFKYYSPNNYTLLVLGDNDSVLAELPISAGQVAKTATVPLYKTSQLTFRVNGVSSDQKIFIFDAKLS